MKICMYVESVQHNCISLFAYKQRLTTKYFNTFKDIKQRVRQKELRILKDPGSSITCLMRICTGLVELGQDPFINLFIDNSKIHYCGKKFFISHYM